MSAGETVVVAMSGGVDSSVAASLLVKEGYCPIHEKISAEHIKEAREKFPDAPVLVHPECTEAVSLAADHVLSTGGMVKFAKESAADTIVVGTEIGLLHRLEKESPNKRLIKLFPEALCPTMKLHTLEKIVTSLETMGPTVVIPEAVRVQAEAAVARMLG